VLWLEAAHMRPSSPDAFAAPVLRITSQIDRANQDIALADLGISVATGEGLPICCGRSRPTPKRPRGSEGSLVTRARHRDALTEAKRALDRACAAPERILPEYWPKRFVWRRAASVGLPA